MIMNKKLNNQENYFQTSDISLCATLCCYGYQLESVDSKNPQRAVFLINKNEQLDNLIQKYWTHQLQVEPMSFFNYLKEIKTRIYNTNK